MTLADIAKLRMQNQRIAGEKFKKPEDVVRHFGAMQAQDYQGALWAIGLRMQKATQADVENALAKKKIIRTWPMRGTLHFVAAEDAHWMLELMAPPIIRKMDSYHRRFGLSKKEFDTTRKILTKALRGGKQFTRPALYQMFEKAGISTKNSRGLHILGLHAYERVICFGVKEGKQHTFVLMEEWLAPHKPMPRDEALAKLAVRYFTSHGPAQIQDLAWWSGLSMKDIRRGIELAGRKLIKEEVEGKAYWMAPGDKPRIQTSSTAYLLPSFDEFLVAYRDRSASLEAIHAQHINPGANGMLSPVVVVNGQALGTWKRTFKKNDVIITPVPFVKFTSDQKKAIEKAGRRYRAFLNLK